MVRAIIAERVAASGLSTNALFLLFSVLLIGGFFVIERSRDHGPPKTENPFYTTPIPVPSVVIPPPPPPPPSPPGPDLDQRQTAPEPDVPDVEQRPKPKPSTATEYDIDGIDSGEYPPFQPIEEAPKTRSGLKGAGAVAPTNPTKPNINQNTRFVGGVATNDDRQASTATGIRGHEVDAGPRAYHSDNNLLVTHQDKKQGDLWSGHPNETTSVVYASPLPHIRATLEAGGDTLAPLLELMDEAETIAQTSWLQQELKMESNKASAEEVARCTRALHNFWEKDSDWGLVPTVIDDVVREMVRHHLFDTSKLIGAMMDQPHIRKGRACDFDALIAANYKAEAVETVTSDKGPAKVQPADEGEGKGENPVKSVKYTPKTIGAERELLLGWFVLPYRAYSREQWTDVVPHFLAGHRLTRKFSETLNGVEASLLMWLAWAGRQFLVNRLFTKQGAELLDANVRAVFLPLDRADPEGGNFVWDVTIFVPDSTKLRAVDGVLHGPALDLDAHWLRASGSLGRDGARPGKGERGLGKWFKDALNQCSILAYTWMVEKLSEKGVEGQDFAGRVTRRRLQLRPGYPLNDAKKEHNQIAARTGTMDIREPILVPVHRADILAVFPLERQISALSHAYDVFGPDHIRFFNKRQNAWHASRAASSTDGPAKDKDSLLTASCDRFDSKQLAFVFGLLIRALGPRFEKRQTYNDLPVPDQRPHAVAVDVPWQTARDNGGAIRHITMDFGGMIPYIVSGHPTGLGVRFPWPSQIHDPDLEWVALKLPAVTTWYLPLLYALGPNARHQLNYGETEPLLEASRARKSITAWFLDDDTQIHQAMRYGARFVVVAPHMADIDPIFVAPLQKALVFKIIRDWIKRDGRSREWVIDYLKKEYLPPFREQLGVTEASQCQTFVMDPVLSHIDLFDSPGTDKPDYGPFVDRIMQKVSEMQALGAKARPAEDA